MTSKPTQRHDFSSLLASWVCQEQNFQQSKAMDLYRSKQMMFLVDFPGVDLWMDDGCTSSRLHSSPRWRPTIHVAKIPPLRSSSHSPPPTTMHILAHSSVVHTPTHIWGLEKKSCSVVQEKWPKKKGKEKSSTARKQEPREGTGHMAKIICHFTSVQSIFPTCASGPRFFHQNVSWHFLPLNLSGVSYSELCYSETVVCDRSIDATQCKRWCEESMT